jgi:hypothetical protein
MIRGNVMIHRHKLGRSWLIGPALVALALLCALVCSCTITLRDSGEVSVDFRQGITVSHKTAKTNSESVASSDFKPLVDYIIQLRESSAEADPGGEEPTTQPVSSSP